MDPSLACLPGSGTNCVSGLALPCMHGLGSLGSPMHAFAAPCGPSAPIRRWACGLHSPQIVHAVPMACWERLARAAHALCAVPAVHDAGTPLAPSSPPTAWLARRSSSTHWRSTQPSSSCWRGAAACKNTFFRVSAHGAVHAFPAAASLAARMFLPVAGGWRVVLPPGSRLPGSRRPARAT